jgi:phosphoglycolate phosphatase
MLKCVVFDFDGTLVDSNDIKRETFFDIARSWDPSGEVVAEVFKLWPAADRYEKTKNIAEGLISRKLLPENSSIAEWAALLASEYTAQCERAISCCAEMPGATKTLSELSAKGYLLFVNSATPAEPLRKLLDLRSWTHFFQAIYGAEASKSDNLRHIAARTGARAHEIAHVGDQRDDLHATQQFGCHFVATAACNSGPIAKESPLVVKDLRDLPGLLNKIAQEAS